MLMLTRVIQALLLVVATLPLADAQDAVHGANLYAQHCARCHAANPRNDPSAARGVILGAGNPARVTSALNVIVEMRFLKPLLTLPRDSNDLAAYLAAAFAPPAAPKLTLPGYYVFPPVTLGSSSSHAFTVINSGTAAALLTTVQASNPDFRVASESCTGGSIPAGGNCQVNLVFAPTSAGVQYASVTVAGTASGTFAMEGSGVLPNTNTGTAVEYLHAGFGHYFLTHKPEEITALDKGTIAGWSRTGYQFKVFAAPAQGLTPVCRFFTAAFAPKSSHFYAANATECTTLKASPDWTFEAEVFFVRLPGNDGFCPAGTQPAFRLYNQGHGGAPNHRYTIDMTARTMMQAQGWVAEGTGIGVSWCVPQ